ncbi:MAG: site-specific integrase, partial [Thiothrix sp.]|nr:site-specific integrase [Thiothrix sp.]
LCSGVNIYGMEPVSWNNYLRHLRALVNYAIEIDECRHWQPLRGIRELPVQRHLQKTVSDRDLKTVLAFLASDAGSDCCHPGWFWVKVIRTLYYTGMRRRQLVGLVWADCDFETRSVRLRAETSKTRRAWDIPMPEPVAAMLRALQERSAVVMGREPGLQDQVFNVTLFHSRYKGRQMTEAQVSGFFRRLKNQTGIAISTHRLRHTFGTKAARTGQLRQVQAVMGHADLKTTLGYVQADMSGMRDVMGAVQL